MVIAVIGWHIVIPIAVLSLFFNTDQQRGRGIKLVI